MLFLAPKWWPTIYSSRGVWPLGRPGSKESGACVPLKKVASLFVPWRLPMPPRQTVVLDDTRVIRPSVVNTFGTDDSVATDGPHRPTVGSRPWTSPAKERAVALTAQYFCRRLRYDRPQIGTPADGRLRVVTSPPRPDGRPKLWGKAGSEHKRPIQWVGACEGLSSLRLPETNGRFWCSALALVRSKYLYARLPPAGGDL